jgi:hypothetical protein
MRSLLLTSLIAGLWASPSLALTADELWHSWQDMAAGDGMRLTARVTRRDHNGLRLTDLHLEGAAINAINLTGSLSLSDTPEGAVLLHPDPNLRLLIDAPDHPVEAQLASTDTSLRITQSLDGQAYGLRAKKLTLAFASDSPGDAPAQELAPARVIYLANMGFDGLEADFSFARNPPLRMNMAIKTARMHVDSTEDNAAIGAYTSDSSDAQDFAMTLAATLPASVTWAAMQAPEVGGGLVGILSDGFSVKLATQQGAYSSTLTQKSLDANFDLTMKSQPGWFKLDADAQGFGYDFSLNGLQAKLNLPDLDLKEMPFSFANFSSALHLPVTDAAPKPFKFHLKLQDLATDAAGWARLDASNSIGHEPWQMQIDLDGNMTLQAAVQDGQVFVHDLNLTQFLLHGLGASLTGNAALHFLPGEEMPLPIGTGSARLLGVQKLIDALISGDQLPKDMALGLRFGLAMITDKPADAGPEEDVLESKLDARADGSLYVNNQKFK